jgi:antitoxin (DNA-binding transcriptional repressor) of toxin-antitoxin stability system
MGVVSPGGLTLPGLPRSLPVATFHKVRSVGLELLRDKLAEYVRLAANGETILVTDRERVVAELSPLHIGRAESSRDPRSLELVWGRLISPPTRPRSTPPASRPVAPTEEVLVEPRADRDAR